MDDTELTSYENDEDNITLRKNFSKFVTKIEVELQRYGVQVPQSEILGFIMEKLTSGFFQKAKLSENGNIPTEASEDEIARYIIGRKYPYMFRFDEENTGLNWLQKYVRNSRINNLSDFAAMRILRISQSISVIFLLLSLFLGTQSLFSLISIFTSHEDTSISLKRLDGDLIYGYSTFWRPEILIIMSFFFIIDVVQTYLVLNIPTLGKIMPELNDLYSRTILRMKITLTMGFAYLSYLLIGSIVIIREERINGLDPMQDLGIPLIVSILSLFIGGLMMLQFWREKISSLEYKRIKMRNRSTFYFINFLTTLLSLILLIYLSLVVYGDAQVAVDAPTDAREIEYDLNVLNFATTILLSYYFVIFIISGLINNSHDKNNWLKFMRIQIIFQTILIIIYSLAELWIITRFNDFMQLWENDLRIPLDDLWQGFIRYFISILISMGFLRLSK